MHAQISQISMMQDSESRIITDTENRGYCDLIADAAITSWISRHVQLKDASYGSKMGKNKIDNNQGSFGFFLGIAACNIAMQYCIFICNNVWAFFSIPPSFT